MSVIFISVSNSDDPDLSRLSPLNEIILLGPFGFDLGLSRDFASVAGVGPWILDGDCPVGPGFLSNDEFSSARLVFKISLSRAL